MFHQSFLKDGYSHNFRGELICSRELIVMKLKVNTGCCTREMLLAFRRRDEVVMNIVSGDVIVFVTGDSG